MSMKRTFAWLRGGLWLSALVAALGLSTAAENDEYAGQFNYGQTREKGKEWVQSIKVVEPAYRSTIKGKTTIIFKAPGMELAEARCWHQPDKAHPGKWGYDAIVMEARKIDGSKETSFDFPADAFPHGPTNIRISTRNSKGKKDVCELQLFNEGGVKWNQGIPEEVPPGAKGMRLLFADDFDKMPKISPRGAGAAYSAHKPPRGDFSGWRFSHKADFAGAHDPFEQKGTWLRIKARAPGKDRKKWGSGILASARFDGSGFWVDAPCYLECRFTAQSAPGTWPAFWTLAPKGDECDELDIIEGYGGVGRGNPNSDKYHIVSHFWRQKNPDGSKKKGFHRRVPMMEMGGKSFWSTTFHTYAVMIGKKETVYYFDNMEVLRHPSGPISANEPAFFLINYAIGGISGWKIDLQRYGNGTDMWVDYVRVYGGRVPTPEFTPSQAFIFGEPAKVTISNVLKDAKIYYTTDGTEPTEQSQIYKEPIAVDKECTVKALAVVDGLLPSRIGSCVVKQARSADNPAATKPGLVCKHYEGKWLKLPDFTKLKPTFSVISSDGFTFPERSKKDYFALTYTGFIDIPADGSYTFYTKSDDGSQLYIGDRLVVDNDGAHGPIEKKGMIGLRAGKHAIEVHFFEARGGDSLEVNWAGPKFRKTLVRRGVLSHVPGEAGDAKPEPE